MRCIEFIEMGFRGAGRQNKYLKILLETALLKINLK